MAKPSGEQTYTIPLTDRRMAYFHCPYPLSRRDERFVKQMVDLFMRSLVEDEEEIRQKRDAWYDQWLSKEAK